MKVLLKYSYIFDPTETWQAISQFEDNFAKMLDKIGLEAKYIRVIGDDKDNPSERIIEICKKESIVSDIQKQTTLKQQKLNMMKQAKDINSNLNK